MADLQSASIAESKIKVRWEEPYISEGLNRGLSLMPRGVYRGFIAKESAVADQEFRLMIDPTGGGINSDSALAYWDRTDGFGLVVRDNAEPTFDMSARFSDGGAIPAGGEIWWVWADVDYSTGNPTTGTYHVTLDGVSIHDDAIYLAKITMIAGDTILQDSNITIADMTLPYPTKREDGAYMAGDNYHGLLTGEEAWNVPTSDHKRAMNSAVTAPTASNPFVTEADSTGKILGQPTRVDYTGVSSDEIQLTGKVVYVGKGIVGTATAFVSLREHENIETPLKSATNVLYEVTAIYDSTNGHELIPSSEADAAGFYTSPWVHISTTYTGDLSVLYGEKKTLSTIDQAPASAFGLAMAFLKDHADDVFGKAVTDSPDSLSAGTVTAQLTALLGLINNKPEKTTVLSQPTFVDYTSLSANKIQLTGKIVYVGLGIVGTANDFLSLRAYQDMKTPLKSATNVLYKISAIYDSTDDHELIPSSEADTEGFYTSPWVYISTSYTGDLSILYGEKSTLDTLDQTPASAISLAMAFLENHGDNILGKAIADSPDSLTAGTVTEQVTATLGLINDRIETINPNGSTTPVLLWRSHGVTSDANVTPETVSIYFADWNFCIIIGGYVSGLDVGDMFVFTSGNDAGNVTVYLFGDTNYNGVTNVLSAGTAFESDDSNWATFILENNNVNLSGRSEHEAIRIEQGLLHLYPDSWILGSDPIASSATEMLLLFESGVMSSTDTKVRIYFGSIGTSTAYFWITFNAAWVYLTQKWTPDAETVDAYAVCMSKSGIYFSRNDNDNTAKSWGYDPNTGWPAALRFFTPTVSAGTNTTYSYPTASGLLSERLTAHSFVNNARSTTDTAVRYVTCNCQYRTRWISPPTLGSYVAGADLRVDAPAVYNISLTEKDGCRVQTVSDDLLDAGQTAYFSGYVDVYA